MFLNEYREWIKRRTTYGDTYSRWTDNYVKHRDYSKWADKVFGLSGLVFVPVVLYSLLLLFQGLYLKAFLNVLGIFVYCYLLFKFFGILERLQGKRYKKKDEWPLRNKHLIEDATTAEYQALSKQEHYTISYFKENAEPLREIEFYQGLDERIEYLKSIPAAIEYINSVIKEKYPFLSKVTNNEELEEVITLLADNRFVDIELLKNPNVYPEARDVELELMKKHNINVPYIEQQTNYFHDNALNKIHNILDTYNKESAILNLGVVGEDKLKQALDLHSDDFNVLYNVRLEVDGQSIESDALVFSQTGIYSIEVKNFGSTGKYSISIAADGQWLKCFPNGKQEPMKDVTAQTNRHIAYQNKFLAIHIPKLDLKARRIKTNALIVIGNDNVIVTNNSSQTIVRTSQLYNLIMNNPIIYSKKDIDILYNLFKENSLSAQKFPYRDLISEYKNLVDALTVLFDLKLRFRKARTDYYVFIEEKVPDNYYLLKNSINFGIIKNYEGCRLLSTERFIEYVTEDLNEVI